MTTIAVPRRRSDNLAQRWLRTGGDHPRTDASPHHRNQPATATFNDNVRPASRAAAVRQPRDQPPQRALRTRAHTFGLSQIPIAKYAVFSAYHFPAGSFLGGFRTPATGECRTAFLAGIRNPAQDRRIDDVRDVSGVPPIACVLDRGANVPLLRDRVDKAE